MSQPTIVDRRRNRSDALGPAARVSTSTLKPKKTEPQRQPAAAPPKPEGPVGPPMPFAAANAIVDKLAAAEEAERRRDQKNSELWPPVEDVEAWCEVCGGLLYQTPGGPVCDYEHAGLPQISWEAAATKLYDAGKSAEETALRMVAELEDIDAFFKELDARPPTGALADDIRQGILAGLENGSSVEAIMEFFPRVPRVVIDALAEELAKTKKKGTGGVPGTAEDGPSMEVPREAANKARREEREVKAARASADDAALEKAAEETVSKRRNRKAPAAPAPKPQTQAAPKIDPRQMSFPDEPANVPYVTDRLIKTKSGKEYTAKLSVELNEWTGFVTDIPQHEGFGPLASRDELIAKLTEMLEAYEEAALVREREKTVREWLVGGMSPDNVMKSILGTLVTREQVDRIAAELWPDAMKTVLENSGLNPAKFGAAPPDPNRPVAADVFKQAEAAKEVREVLREVLDAGALDDDEGPSVLEAARPTREHNPVVPSGGFVTLEAHRALEERVARLEDLVKAAASMQLAQLRVAEAQEQEEHAAGLFLDLLRRFK